jgi:hypothetical protein
MADRNPSFFGPTLPEVAGSPPAFTDDELVLIRARRLEVEVLRAHDCAWPGRHRFATILPSRRPSPAPQPPPVRAGC